jgi:DNA-nicking Smr family endonuclease
MSNKIDLHGIKHENVQKELDQFYWEMMQRGHSEVEVVTGISHIMKDIVKRVSDDYNFTVQDIPLNPGALIVRIK